MSSPGRDRVSLGAHPDVEACGVISRSDDKRGEVPVAFVELQDDSPLQSAELRTWAGEPLRLTSARVRFSLWRAFPQSNRQSSTPSTSRLLP